MNRVELIREFLKLSGFDMQDENLKGTPDRIVRMYDELFYGEGKDPDVKLTTFADGDYNDLIVCKDIKFYSTCSHHFLPFFGRCDVVYIPKDRVIGLSKIPRIVDHYAHRAQIQERLVVQIADFLFNNLDLIGVLVTMEAEHMCLAMRGAQKPGTKMITTAVRGVIDREDALDRVKR